MFKKWFQERREKKELIEELKKLTGLTIPTRHLKKRIKILTALIEQK